MVHALVTHAPAAFAGAQAAPHPPQFGVLELVSISHPSAASLLQSAHGAVHDVTEHEPPTQASAELLPTQRVPHVPQFSPSLFRSTSHPSAASLLQSANPTAH